MMNKNKSEKKEKFRKFNKLDKWALGIGIVSLIGFGSVNNYYKDFEKPKSYLKYEQIFRDISNFEKAKESASYLQNSKNDKLSSLDWNVNKLEEEIRSSYAKQDSLVLKNDYEFKNYKCKKNIEKGVGLSFLIPFLSSFLYFHVRTQYGARNER